MSTDRELIEAAALAAGLDLGYWNEERECFYYQWRSPLTNCHDWHPLADDGDALRLAIHLQLTIMQLGEKVGVSFILDGRLQCYDREVGTDRFAATRRIIVEVAAAVAMNPRTRPVEDGSAFEGVNWPKREPKPDDIIEAALFIAGEPNSQGISHSKWGLSKLAEDDPKHMIFDAVTGVLKWRGTWAEAVAKMPPTQPVVSITPTEDSEPPTGDS